MHIDAFYDEPLFSVQQDLSHWDKVKVLLNRIRWRSPRLPEPPVPPDSSGPRMEFRNLSERTPGHSQRKIFIPTLVVKKPRAKNLSVWPLGTWVERICQEVPHILAYCCFSALPGEAIGACSSSRWRPSPSLSIEAKSPGFPRGTQVQFQHSSRALPLCHKALGLSKVNWLIYQVLTEYVSMGMCLHVADVCLCYLCWTFDCLNPIIWWNNLSKGLVFWVSLEGWHWSSFHNEQLLMWISSSYWRQQP